MFLKIAMSLLALLCFNLVTLACPARGKSKDRYHCAWIGIAQYKGYEHADSATHEHPPLATFWITRTLKGPPFGVRKLPVHYVWDEKARQLRPSTLKSDDSIMPRKDSWWIIFLPDAVPHDGGFETFNGADGRLQFSEENLDGVLDGIEKVEPSLHFDSLTRQRIKAESGLKL